MSAAIASTARLARLEILFGDLQAQTRGVELRRRAPGTASLNQLLLVAMPFENVSQNTLALAVEVGLYSGNDGLP
jgi:hypothetical protein